MKRREILTAAVLAAAGGLVLGRDMPAVSAMPAHPPAAVARFMATIGGWGLPAAGAAASVPRHLTLVEFFDYHCPYCRAMSPYLPALLDAHPDVRLLFAEYPILAPDSAIASRLALAAARQNLYLPAHDWLFRQHGRYTTAMVGALAAAIGADAARLRRDMNDPAIGMLLDRLQFAGERLDLQGTPAMVTTNGVVEGFLPPAGLTALVRSLRTRNAVRRA